MPGCVATTNGVAVGTTKVGVAVTVDVRVAVAGTGVAVGTLVGVVVGVGDSREGGGATSTHAAPKNSASAPTRIDKIGRWFIAFLAPAGSVTLVVTRIVAKHYTYERFSWAFSLVMGHCFGA